MERKEKKKKSHIQHITEIKSHIENEIRDICNDFQNLIDKY